MAGHETQINGLKVQWIDHSTVKIKTAGPPPKVIYIDPFGQVLKGNEEKADLIISTHDHFDHFDAQAINQLTKDDTEVVLKKGISKGALKAKQIRELDIGASVEAKGTKIRAVHAYNEHRFKAPGQPFHPKGFGMGVILEIEKIKFYYAGDTDFIGEMKALKDEKIDAAFLPIGGLYTMDLPEAVEAAVAISPKIVIPTHYNFLSGTNADPSDFKKRVESKSKIEVRIL